MHRYPEHAQKLEPTCQQTVRVQLLSAAFEPAPCLVRQQMPWLRLTVRFEQRMDQGGLHAR